MEKRPDFKKEQQVNCQEEEVLRTSRKLYIYCPCTTITLMLRWALYHPYHNPHPPASQIPMDPTHKSIAETFELPTLRCLASNSIICPFSLFTNAEGRRHVGILKVYLISRYTISVVCNFRLHLIVSPDLCEQVQIHVNTLPVHQSGTQLNDYLFL